MDNNFELKISVLRHLFRKCVEQFIGTWSLNSLEEASNLITTLIDVLVKIGEIEKGEIKCETLEHIQINFSFKEKKNTYYINYQICIHTNEKTNQFEVAYDNAMEIV